MRIVSWNINGIRTLPQYYPWNTLKTFDDILNYLQADIICFQEVKSSRHGLPKQVALPDSYNSFFSFPVSKTGYSGVVAYTRTDTVIPFKAEEGLTGLVQPRPPFSEEERISRSGSYPPDVADPDTEEVNYKDLDSEGRALVIDFGLFVLINVYCPNDGSGSKERENFKMNYHRLLEARVDGLIQEGRQVMVVGDLNACAAVEDHCEGPLMVARGLAEGLEGEEGFWGKQYRRWIRDWLIKDDGTGSLVDIVRKLWPDRKGMYTCWNTKISARETNYGTRIDFILVTPGLVPWMKQADIQPHVKGSDHCPVFVDLRDEITNSDGSFTKLRDLLGVPTRDGLTDQLPRLAAKYWDEHKQRLLSTFFVKKSDCPSHSSSQRMSEAQTSSEVHGNECAPDTRHQIPPMVGEEPQTPGITKRRIAIVSSSNPSTKKVRLSSSQQEFSKSSGKTVGKSGQSTIASFFSQSQPPPGSTSRLASNGPSSSLSPSVKRHTRSNVDSTSLPTHDVDEDADYHTSPFRDKDKGRQAWHSFLAPTQIPNCTAHGEPAKEFTVNKPGPNKGKKFFVCSRPVGPGYDKGRAERLREQVNPQFRCNFFKWSSDVRRQTRTDGMKNSK